MNLCIIDRGSDRNTWSYITKSLSNDEILKSLNKSDLVQVQRTVHKKGTTFTQMFWVKPNKVKKTDHVVQGRENLHLKNAKAFKASGNKGDESDEHYKFITAADGANSITADTKIEAGTSEETKGKVVNVVNQLSNLLADNIEEIINQSKHIGSSDVDEWEDAYFQSTYGMSKDEYFQKHHVNLPEHFHVEPHVQKITKKRIRVIYNTSLDYDKVNEGTKAALKAAFLHDQINEVEFRNVKGKLAIRLKVSNKGMYTDGMPLISKPVKSKPSNSSPPAHLTKEAIAIAAKNDSNLEPLTKLSDEQLEPFRNIAEANELFGALRDDGTPCPSKPYTDRYADFSELSQKCEWSKWWKSLTKEQKTAIRDYICSQYTYPMNGILNGMEHPSKSKGWDKDTEHIILLSTSSGVDYLGCHSVEGYRLHCEGFYSEDDKPKLKSMAEGLNSAIAKVEIKRSFISFRRETRYSKYGGEDLLKKYIDAGQGGIVNIGSVWSTTPIQGSFSPGGTQQIEYKIRIPAGKGIGMYVEPKSQLHGENEFIIGSNSYFKVLTDMKTLDTTADRITVELEYVGRKDKPFDAVWEEARAKGLVRDKSNRTLEEEKKSKPQKKKDEDPNKPAPKSNIFDNGYTKKIGGSTLKLQKKTNPFSGEKTLAVYVDNELIFADIGDAMPLFKVAHVTKEQVGKYSKYKMDNDEKLQKMLSTIVSVFKK